MVRAFLPSANKWPRKKAGQRQQMRTAIRIVLLFLAASVATKESCPLYVSPREEFLGRNGVDCGAYSWLACPPSYGIIANTSSYAGCCPSSLTECPTIAPGCTPQNSCCPAGTTTYCYVSETRKGCCEPGYAYCTVDPTQKLCSTGACQCTGCVGADPCSHTIGCADCASCCSSYIQYKLCTGWQCADAIAGLLIMPAKPTCNSPPSVTSVSASGASVASTGTSATTGTQAPDNTTTPPHRPSTLSVGAVLTIVIGGAATMLAFVGLLLYVVFKEFARDGYLAIN